MSTIEQIKSLLNLKPHMTEGGYFTETYRAEEYISEQSLPDRYHGSRSFVTAIYYPLTHDSFSTIHRIQTDEIFHALS